MPVVLIDGNHQKKINYVPTVAITGGKVILIGTTLAIASVDAAIDEEVGLNWPNGGAQYSALNTDGLAFTAGDDLFFDISNDKGLAAGGDGKIGTVTQDVAVTDDVIPFLHER